MKDILNWAVAQMNEATTALAPLRAKLQGKNDFDSLMKLAEAQEEGTITQGDRFQFIAMMERRGAYGAVCNYLEQKLQPGMHVADKNSDKWARGTASVTRNLLEKIEAAPSSPSWDKMDALPIEVLGNRISTCMATGNLEAAYLLLTYLLYQDLEKTNRELKEAVIPTGPDTEPTPPSDPTPPEPEAA